MDQGHYSSQRIASFKADPENPNPSYTHHTIEESIKAHTTTISIYLDDLGATMKTWDG